MPSKTPCHPRRRPGSSSTTAALIDSFAGLSIKKGTTFHSPTSNKSELFNPLEPATRSMTIRSTTSPKALEDLLIGSGERRAADFLTKVDQVIADNSSAAALGKLLSEPEALPNPRCVLNNSGLQDISEERRDSPNNASDSGLGSSIADSDEFDIEKAETSSKGSTLKRSTSPTSNSYADQNLSEFACEQIHNHIVKPILQQKALKDFHPLVRGVPRRIGSREITNLRDLEKTLIFLAPDYSRTPSAYLNFCETYIDCLHATVDIVHESDHCSPSDRPYTNSYFIDLVGQIRRYAQIVAATRAKQDRGEELDEMDVTPNERLRLRGGVTHNSRAELVRHREGKDISLLDGAVLSTSAPADHSTMSSKRPLMDDSLTDGVERSMARRRKGEPIKTYECAIDGCDKIFRRPCDRTKHMKSHERPWKCPHTDCKYHTDGWPTEKEMERHVNDKHAESPIMWGCAWSSINHCPYQSKRLSNCKSHMEKAHNWVYIRSKTTNKNPKAKAKSGVQESELQPIKFVNGVAVDETSPSSLASASVTPYVQTDDFPVNDEPVAFGSRQGSLMPLVASSLMTPLESPELTTPMDFQQDFQQEFTGHFNFDFTFAYPPSLAQDRRLSYDSSATNTAPNSTLLQTEASFDDLFDTPPTPETTPPFATYDGFKLNPADQAGVFISDQSLLYSPNPHMIGADPTFTAPHQPLAAATFGGDSAMDMDMDFNMANYLPTNGNDASLFPEDDQYAFGAQFDGASSSINSNTAFAFADDTETTVGAKIGEPNPYEEYFPELQAELQ